MIDKAQILKGLLDGCILKVVSDKESYGYKITEDLKHYGFKDLNEGSIYPVLVRLEKKGFVSSESKTSPLGPKRKYFVITEGGLDYLNSFNILWGQTSAIVNNILGGTSDDEF